MEQMTMATWMARPMSTVRHGPEDDDDEDEGDGDGEDDMSTRTGTPIQLRPSRAGRCGRRRP